MIIEKIATSLINDNFFKQFYSDQPFADSEFIEPTQLVLNQKLRKLQYFSSVPKTPRKLQLL